MRISIVLSIILVVVGIPTAVYADGGGPLLLFLNGYVFFIGQVWIVLSEFAVFQIVLKGEEKENMIQVLKINILSTCVIGLGFPLLLAIIGLAGSFLPDPLGKNFLLLGTWVMDRVPYDVTLLPYVVSAGLFVTFFLTVLFEARCLQAHWDAKQCQHQVKAITLSWMANTLSYCGLCGLAYFFWQS